MSRINIFGDEQYFGEVLPGYHLIRLVNTKPDPEGLYKEGMWGLTYCNDPDFMFYQDPIEDPSLIDDEIECDNEDLITETAEHYSERLWGDIQSCNRLWQSCLQAGYNPEVHGYNLAYWLMDHMAKFLNEVDWKPDSAPKKLSNFGR